MIIDQKRLKEVIDYNCSTGDFVWIVSSGTVSKGRKAGCLDDKGYVRIKIDGKKYKAHRLVFLYLNGCFPRSEVDHVNGVKNDNRFVNLRLANNTQQNANKKIQINNTSGYRGVHFFKPRGKWRATISVNKKTKYIGSFDTPEEASVAYECEAAFCFGEFYQMRDPSAAPRR